MITAPAYPPGEYAPQPSHPTRLFLLTHGTLPAPTTAGTSMENTSLDIIVTAYNSADHLDECLRSVAQQTHESFQVLVIDNASQDSTAEIGRQWAERDARFRFHRNEKNLGHTHSANRAYGMLSGEYVLQLHADDLLKPDFIQKVLVEGLALYPGCAYAYSLFSRYIDGVETGDVGQFRPDLSTGVHQLIDYLCFTNWIIQSFAIFRRSHFNKVGGFERHIERFRSDDAVAPRGGFLDHYMWIRLATVGPAYVVNEALGLYRVHDASLRKTASGQKRLIQEAIRTYDYIYDDHDLFDDVTRYAVKVNQVGRLLTNNGLVKTAVDMVNSFETGPEIAPIRKTFLSAVYHGLNKYIFDSNEHYNRFMLETPANLASLRSILATLPADPEKLVSNYRR